jgi:hypothetical protein
MKFPVLNQQKGLIAAFSCLIFCQARRYESVNFGYGFQKILSFTKIWWKFGFPLGFVWCLFFVQER